jgi:glycosyltransferase involved in cell wall biosynthesis
MSEGTPLVAIGVPVYNGGRFLATALDSLLAQTLEDLEIVISDNASTDETEAICREYAARDARIRYVRQSRNIGANPNWNAVRQMARGTYFKWASANDRCEPGFVAACVNVLEEREDVVLCYPETRLIDEDGRELQVYDDPLYTDSDDPAERFFEILDVMALNNAFNGVVRAQALAEAGDLKAYFGSDLPLMAALALRGKLHRLPDPLFHRRIGPRSHSTLRRKSGESREYHYTEDRLLMRQYGDYFRAVATAPLAAPLKARLVAGLMRRLNWHRRHLGMELLQALKPSWLGWGPGA